MKDVRKLIVAGQVVYVKPGETVEVESVKYDERVFKRVDIKKSADANEETTKLKEDK